MKFILMPFIGIYHVVSAVMSAPSKLFQMMEDKAFESKDKKQKLKEQKELAALNASNANLAETNVTIAAPTGPTAEEVAVTAQPTDTDGVQLSDMASEDEAMQKKVRPMKAFRYTVLNSFGKKRSWNIRC